MNARWERPVGTLLHDLQPIFADRLLSVTIYGKAVENDEHAAMTAVVIVSSLTQDDLDACAHRAGRWAHEDIGTPIVLPADEFRRSLDAFPLEYAEMIASHVRVFGADPFEGLTIAPEDIRRACERQIKSHLLHLREGYIDTRGQPLAIAHLVAASAPAFGTLLRGVARLLNVQAGTATDTALAGARALGVTDEVVARVLVLEDGNGAFGPDGARLFPDYLAAVEQLGHGVDAWRAY